MDGKPWYESKTIWLGVMLIAWCGVFIFQRDRIDIEMFISVATLIFGAMGITLRQGAGTAIRVALLGLVGLSMLAPAPARAEWTLEPHAHVNLVGIDLTERRIGLQLQPALGLSYTDGDAFVGLAISFDVSQDLEDAWAWTPMVLGGSNSLLTSAGIGYQMREPWEPGDPWRTSWLIVGGLGAPVSRVQNE